jgi:hypothetical protein
VAPVFLIDKLARLRMEPTPTEILNRGLVHLSGQFSAGCEAPICRAFLLIHSAFGYGFVESRNIWGLSLGRNFDRKGERGLNRIDASSKHSIEDV